jgi:hypothetical protein
MIYCNYYELVSALADLTKMPEILGQGIRLWCSGRSAKCNLMVQQKNSNYAFASSIK